MKPVKPSSKREAYKNQSAYFQDNNFYKGKTEGAMKNRLIIGLSKRLFILAVILNKLKGN